MVTYLIPKLIKFRIFMFLNIPIRWCKCFITLRFRKWKKSFFYVKKKKKLKVIIQTDCFSALYLSLRLFLQVQKSFFWQVQSGSTDKLFTILGLHRQAAALLLGPEDMSSVPLGRGAVRTNHVVGREGSVQRDDLIVSLSG